MKIAKSSNTLQVYESDYVISNNIYTRDFKEKPLEQAVPLNDAKILFHYKNPVLLNPTITTYTAIGSTRWKIYTGFQSDGKQYIVQDNIGKSTSSQTSMESEASVVEVSEDFQEYNARSYNKPYARIFEIGNFIYSNYPHTSYNYAQLPMYHGLSIQSKLDSPSRNPLYYTNCYSNGGQYNQQNNDINVRLLDVDENRDLVALDLFTGCGYGTYSVNVGVGSFTGITTAQLSPGSYKRNNDIYVLKLGVDYQAQKFTKEIGSGSDWYTTTVTSAGTYCFKLNSKPSNSHLNEDDTRTFYSFRMTSENQQKAGLWKIVVDEENAKYTTYKLTSTDSEYELPFKRVDLSQYQVVEENGRGYKLEYRRYGSKDLLFLFIDNITIDNMSGIYVYEIDEENNTFTFLSKSDVPSNALFNYFLIDDNTLLITSNLGYSIFRFDTSDYTWKKSCDKMLDLWAMVYDDVSNALFYVDNSNNIYMDKLDLTMSSDWGWTDTNLSWEGSDINTSIYLGCKNYLSEYIEVDVTLYLYGNAVFTDNGEKQITVTTSTSGRINVPVTITGDGVVNCSAKAAS